jgi:hypothetical protein
MQVTSSGNALDGVAIEQSAALGSFLVARRAFAEGQVVTHEVPLLVWAVDCTIPLNQYFAAPLAAFLGAPKVTQDTVLALFCPADARLAGHHSWLHVVEFCERTVSERVCVWTVPQLVRFCFICKYNATQYQANQAAIFQLHARINHSCAPNACFNRGDVRALRSIAAEEPITISYFGCAELVGSTAARQTYLRIRYDFECQCERCLAPECSCIVM